MIDDCYRTYRLVQCEIKWSSTKVFKYSKYLVKFIFHFFMALSACQVGCFKTALNCVQLSFQQWLTETYWLMQEKGIICICVNEVMQAERIAEDTTIASHVQHIVWNAQTHRVHKYLLPLIMSKKSMPSFPYKACINRTVCGLQGQIGF